MYKSLRHKLSDGDLILWRGKTPIARLIQLFGQHYNHASIIIETERHGVRRVLLYEALSHGVEPEFLSARLKRYWGEAWCYPLKPEFDQFRPAIYKAANNYAGRPYDYKALFSNIFGLVSVDVSRLLCSEFYFVCGRDGGLPCSDQMNTPRPDGLLDLGWHGRGFQLK